MDIPDQEDCCESVESHRAHILKTLSPEGLIKCLEEQLKTCTDDIDFLNKKLGVLNSSIEKLKKP